MTTSPKEPRFLVFDTHPIQYRSPVFKKLSKLSNQFQVCYFSNHFQGSQWWFHEVGSAHSHAPNAELQKGFLNQVIHTDRCGLLDKFRLLKSLLQSSRPDAVAIYGWYLPEHWILWGLCRHWNIPLLFIGETFTKGAPGWRRTIKNFLHPIFFSKVARVVSIGNKTTEFYRSLKIEEEKIVQAKYCVDVKSFELDTEKSQEIRRQVRASLKIPNEAFVSLFVGRLFERKRPQDMVELHKRLSKETHYYTLMAGQGEMLEELKKSTQDFERFQLLGYKTQSQLRDLYHAADVLIVPSRYETWGLVINEAFAAGLPALVTNSCGAAEDLVRSGETGFIFPVGEIGTAAIQIRTLMETPESLSKLSASAKNLVHSEYSVDQFAHSMNFALKEAIGHPL